MSLYSTLQQIETELETLNKDYEEYVKEVNDVNNEHYAELKGFVEQGYVDRRPAARMVMKEDLDPKKRGEYSEKIPKMSLCVRKPTIWVPTRSDTNQHVQSQNQDRSLKFRI